MLMKVLFTVLVYVGRPQANPPVEEVRKRLCAPLVRLRLPIRIHLQGEKLLQLPQTRRHSRNIDAESWVFDESGFGVLWKGGLSL